MNTDERSNDEFNPAIMVIRHQAIMGAQREGDGNKWSRQNRLLF